MVDGQGGLHQRKSDVITVNVASQGHVEGGGAGGAGFHGTTTAGTKCRNAHGHGTDQHVEHAAAGGSNATNKNG